MNKYLLEKLEGKTPTFLNGNGGKRQGRGLFGLLLMAFFALRARREQEKRKHWLGWQVLRVSAVLGVMMTLSTTMNGALPDTTTINGTHLYQINLAKDASASQYLSVYFITPSSPKVSIKDNPGADELWYVLETDDTPTGTFTRPHIEHYCYIVNAVSGQYLYYTGTNSNSIETNVVEMKDINAAGVEIDRFKFIIKQSGNGDTENYWVFPKIAAENNPTQYESNRNGYLALGVPQGNASYSNGTTLSKERNGVWTSQWVFVSSSLLAAPTITFTSETNIFSISHSILSSGCTIYYTIDGSTPSTASTPYSGPVIVNVPETVKAVVIRDYDNIVLTEVGSLEVEPLVVAPTVTNNFDGTISLSTPTPNAVMYYTTDGTIPSSSNGTQYSSAFSLGNATVIKAIALSGIIYSGVTTYNVPQYATPTISFNYNTSIVSINSGNGSTAYYNTGDGSQADPTTSSTVYSAPFTISSATTVKAIATHAGYLTSDVVTLSISQVATPTIQNNGSNAISITSATPGATIYYTTDGSTPTTSSNLYTSPLQENVSGVTIKAIAVKENMINSEVGSGSVTLQCETPVITRVGLSFTLSCSMPTDATLYYTLDGGSETVYSGAVTFTIDQLPMTVTAVARHSDYTDSEMATLVLRNGTGTPTDPYLIHSTSDFSNFVTNVNNGTTASACYKLEADVSANGTAAITTAFTGTFDGDFYTITDLTHPLFNTVNGAVIKNVILKNVSISGSGNVGAICNEAKAYTRIYNCGILPTTANFPNDTHSSVTATGTNGCAGGLVGLLDDDSRVVNCFSYADVSSTGYAAGIVGNNTFASTAEVSDGKYYKLRTMVVNCMYYGDITAGSNVWPVYGGEKIINGGGRGADLSDGYYAINNYNFYCDSCSFPAGKEPSTTHIYNCSWPANYEYLTRYEFHRYLLNSNRELCGWWVGAPSAPSTMSTTDVQAVPKDATLMAKWVLDRSVAPFPILKPFGYYPSPINIDADATWRESANEWEGKKLGMVSVTVNPGNHAPSSVTTTTTPLEITFTDMDTLRGDFCYRKIQLPYYNSVFGNPNGTTWEAKYGGNYGEYAVTGWEITKVNGSSTGTGDFVADWQDGYNFADRNSTKKDLYGVSGRIFAQGGYYYVPNDVTTIEITAHWGKAVYLGNGDNYYDRVDLDYLVEKASGSSTNGTTIRENRAGTAFEPAGTRPSTLDNGQPVRTGNIKEVATSYISNSGTVFDNALVLVGNHQYCTGDWHVNPSRSFTIMSVDFDFDNEPDYCLDWQLGKGVTRFSICPIRFDFLPVVEIGLGLKKDGSTQYYSLGCYHPLGHFEVTETALIRIGQFEFSNRRTTECPIILNGGIFDQYVKGTTGGANAENDKITYIILGGNLKMLSFTPGSHVNSSFTYTTRHCAVNVIGGRFESLYLSGNFNEAVTPYADNPHCYIDGGWFGHVAAAGKEGIGNPNASDPKGNVTFKINHSVIREFYGGGIMMGHEVTGNIDVTIDNSLVNKYCGGPKFGDMTSGKTVTTSATGTTFGVYYGAGNGGTNYVQYDRTDGTYYNNNGFNWNGTGTGAGHINNYSPGAYRNTATGYQANYDMELINTSTGSFYDCAVNRTYFYAAQFATTNTGTVTNTLLNCLVKTNFYGAGNLGGVNGNVISTLTDTEVRGSAFGGGFSASIPEVKIYNADKIYPVIDVYTGYITPSTGGTYSSYIWSNDPSLSTGSPAGDGIFFTEVPLVNLGTVTGNVDFTIKGGSKVGGSIFGGGDESAVNGNTLVKVLDQTKVFGNIYGGGNIGKIGGNTKVIINGVPHDSHDGFVPDNNSSTGTEPSPHD